MATSNSGVWSYGLSTFQTIHKHAFINKPIFSVMLMELTMMLYFCFIATAVPIQDPMCHDKPNMPYLYLFSTRTCDVELFLTSVQFPNE